LFKPSDLVTLTFVDPLNGFVGRLDADGILTADVLDARGNVIMHRVSTTPVTAAARDAVPSYDPAGLATLFQDDDTVTRVSYDGQAGQTSATDPGGHWSETQFNADGSVVALRGYAQPVQPALWSQDFTDNSTAGLSGAALGSPYIFNDGRELVVSAQDT